MPNAAPFPLPAVCGLQRSYLQIHFAGCMWKIYAFQPLADETIVWDLLELPL